MSVYQNAQELFQLMKAELFTAVVGDVLDAAGHTHRPDVRGARCA